MLHPRDNILRRAEVAMVRGRPRLMYRNTHGIPSMGHMTPEKKSTKY